MNLKKKYLTKDQQIKRRFCKGIVLGAALIGCLVGGIELMKKQ